MARIVIQNLSKRTIEITDYSQSLLRHFQEHGIDWMYACGGKGRCTTCRLIIAEGEANVQPLTEAEQKYYRQGALLDQERLACQTRISGDVTVIVPKENQLPHMRYSDE